MILKVSRMIFLYIKLRDHIACRHPLFKKMKLTEGEHFNRAQVAQQEGRWRDAIVIIEEGDKNGCKMCSWWLLEIFYRGYWGKTSHDPACRRLMYKTRLLPRPIAVYNDGKVFIGESITMDPFVVIVCYIHQRLGFKCDFNKVLEYLNICYNGLVTYPPFSDDVLETIYQKAVVDQNPVNQWLLGLFLHQRHRIEESLLWLRRSAEQECVEAQKKLYDHFMTMCRPTPGRYWYNRMMQLEPELFLSSTRRINQDHVFDAIEKCQQSSLCLILIRKYRPQSTLSVIDKHVVIMIAKKLWETREEDCWKNYIHFRFRRKK